MWKLSIYPLLLGGVNNTLRIYGELGFAAKGFKTIILVTMMVMNSRKLFLSTYRNPWLGLPSCG